MRSIDREYEQEEESMEIITVRKLKEDFYQLSEHISSEAAVHMYLVTGSKCAALSDTGLGMIGNLEKIVRSLTDKPVICLVTHCDPDHAGAAALFDDIRMSALDQKLMDNGSISPLARFGTAQAVADDKARVNYFRKHMVKAKRFAYQNIDDGEIFDLGDRTLTAIAFPGHTEGSMCFWNRAENYCIVGDAVANVDSPVLFFQKCRPLEEYRDNLIRFLDKVGDGCLLYAGHNEEPLPKAMLSEILSLCGEVLSSQTKNDVPYMPPFLQEASADAGVFEKLKSKLIVKGISKKQLGDAVPMEHKGVQASVRYNAKKIYRHSNIGN